jgi:type IV pilus assembly protein PilB
VNDDRFFEKVDAALFGYRLVTDEQRKEIRREIAQRGLTYEHALHQSTNVEQALYKRVLEEVSGCAAVDPSEIAIDPEFIALITDILPLTAIVALKVFPVSLAGNELTLAMPNPTDVELIEDLQATTCVRIRPVVTTFRSVQPAIEQNFSGQLRDALQQIRGVTPREILEKIFTAKTAEGLEPSFDKFVVFVNRGFQRASGEDVEMAHLAAHPFVVAYTQRLLMDVISRNCSDVHLEPAASTYRVRARVNGVLRTLHELPKQCGDVVGLRIRNMAGAGLQDVTQPIDSQINYSPVHGRRLEFRVSILPTIHGPKTVLRLLEKQNQGATLDRMGFTPSELERVRRNIAAPNGLVLVCGPTGSGKTSTLYSILGVLNDEERCIVTAEEPVESEIPGVVQVACGEGCTFATALRAFLRQDPDVIMVGEIRDPQTADIALKAALTGHLVLSTLHTNDAPSAVMRLLNLDEHIDPFVVASSLRMVIAQRLIRTLCNECKKPLPRADALARYSTDDVPPEGELFTRGGCLRCNESGYAGRIGIFEILETSDELADAVSRRAPLAEIRALGERGGMRSLRQRALSLCAEGRTTVDEVVRVTAE